MSHLTSIRRTPLFRRKLFHHNAQRKLWRALAQPTRRPVRAYAPLGQGRCLAALGQADAEQSLREAQELFASMGYKPALAETEALLGETEAAAS